MSAEPDTDAMSSRSMGDLRNRLRRDIITLSHRKRVPHLGSALSCIDIIATLYWRVLNIDTSEPQADSRDRFILSKGHAAKALYVALAHRGFFELDLLQCFNDDGGPLPEHPSRQCVPGVEAATGSLGHGLSIGLGMALTSKIRAANYRVYVLMSDGECNEGSVWEAAMMAPACGVSNLTAIIDFNKWQATGRSTETLALSPLAEKWRAFGWDVDDIDGHDTDALYTSLTRPSHRPKAIVAHTVKGKGISFMEDDNNWHYRIPNDEEFAAALNELARP